MMNCVFRVSRVGGNNCRQFLLAPSSSSSSSSLRRLATFAPSTRKGRGSQQQQQTETVKKVEVDFAKESSLLFASIKNAFTPVLPLNPGFELIESDKQLVLDVGVRGQFVFTKTMEEKVIDFVTPVSGVFRYFFDAERGEWRSVQDGHNITGMITRDFIRYFHGCPQF